MAESDNLHRGVVVRERITPGRVRRVMAKNMQDSVTRAALSQISRQIDLTDVQALRQMDVPEVRPSLNTVLMAVIARTLPDHPLLNAELVGDQIVIFNQVNLGMAIAVPDGLMVGVIQNANQKSMVEIGLEAESLTQRARAGELSLSDIEGGTFTMSNLGMYDIDSAFPLPRPPEGAILLVGRARPQPEFFNGEIRARVNAWFSLTYDHRFIDGATGAKFLQDLQVRFSNLENLK
jgi:pyruvate dehydrogenase E2 component (dihydrolipoamide acetyltransferase)